MRVRWAEPALWRGNAWVRYLATTQSVGVIATEGQFAGFPCLGSPANRPSVAITLTD